MKSSYKPIGDLVERIDERNTDGSVKDLVGVSIDKCFIKSVANTIGTDLTKYKLIRKKDFAVSLMQVSRDEKIPVAMQTDYDVAIMSPAYPIFRVADESIILPEYLDLWFKRSEFDREAAFIAVGGVRGSMPWEEFCRMEVLVPSIEQQHKIVKAYKAITDRIALKQRINDNLASTLNELYKKYFTADNINELPVGWRIVPFSDIATIVMGQSPEGEYCNNEQIGEPLLNGPTEFGTYSPKPVQWTTDGKKYCNEGDILFCVRGSTTGRMNWADQSYVIGRGLAAIRHKSNTSLNWYVKAILDNHLRDILSAATGSTFPNVGKELLNEFKVIIPDESTLSMFSEKGAQLSCLIASNSKEIDKIEILKELLLYRLSY